MLSFVHGASGEAQVSATQQISTAPRLKIVGLSKTFGRTKVLDQVDLEVAPGEIHALVGANGSGKSTLVKVIAGYHTPDRGARLLLDGAEMAFPVGHGNPASVGICVVHQDLGLVGHLSVLENVSVGREHPSSVLRLLDRRREENQARKLMERLGVSLDLRTTVESLAPEERAVVAIARALRTEQPGSGLVVLDETTRALSRDAAESFYRALRKGLSDGSSVLLVAHSLPEVMAVSDRVSVIRDGTMVANGVPTPQLSERAIAKLMLGRETAIEVRAHAPTTPSTGAIQVRGLSVSPGNSLDLTIGRGEILGLTGKAGSPWERMPYAIAGVERPRSGQLQIDGSILDLARSSIRTLLANGVALVPERRDTHGVAAGLSIKDNITLPRLRERGRPWYAGLRWQLQEAQAAVDVLGVRPGDLRMPVGKLSGGNRQKVLLGKWLMNAPRLLVLHEPTQGVDAAARVDLLQAVMSAADAGTSVLFASSDVNDLSAACRRVVVVHDDGPSEELLSSDPDSIVESVYRQVARGGAA